MQRIYAIALNTYREAVRDRVLYGVLGFACAVLFFTLAIAELSLHEQSRVVSDVGLASISLFSVLMAIFLGSSLLYKEIERKTLYVILPKPLSRTEFLLGKFAGIVLTGSVFIALMGALELLVIGLEESLPPSHAALAAGGVALSFGVGAWRVKDRALLLLPTAASFLVVSAWIGASPSTPASAVLGQLALTLAEVWVLAAVALFFSAFSTPFLTGLFTLGVWLLGRSADDMATMKSKQLSEGIRAALHALAEIVPNFQLFVPARPLLLGQGSMPLWHYVGTSLGYAAGYAAFLLLFAALIFPPPRLRVNHPVLRYALAIILGLLVLLSVVSVRGALTAHAELALADHALNAGDFTSGVRHLRRAGRWDGPFNVYAQNALRRLDALARDAERRADYPNALLGYRALHAALAASRSPFRGQVVALSDVDHALAALMARDLTPGALHQPDPKREQAYFAGLSLQRPRTGFVLLAFAGLLSWVLGFASLVLLGIDREGRVVRRIARPSFLCFAFGWVAFAVGLHLA